MTREQRNAQLQRFATSSFISGYKRFLCAPRYGHRLEIDIRRKRTPSAVELRLGHFLGGSVRLGTALSQVLVGLNEFASTILNTNFAAAVRDVPGLQDALFGPELIQGIALMITAGTSGIEAELLRKSVQEVLFQIGGTELELTRPELEERVVSFLRRRGSAGLIRRFLSLHVFNIVWFQTGDSFRSLAWTPKSFVSDMERVERACQQVVQRTWRSLKISGPLDRSSAGQLVEQLSNRLTGA